MEIDDVLNDYFKEAIETKNIACFKDQVVLVTGAAGSIGSKLSLLLLQTKAKKIILLDNSESELFKLEQELLLKDYKNFVIELKDIVCKKSISSVFNKYKPGVVYHTAAYKNVPFLERFPVQAFKVNVLGTQNIVESAIKFKTKEFVYVSTDKAVFPNNIMGYTKRLAEIYISQYIKLVDVNFKIIRFGNIPNTKGSILPLWQTQLKHIGTIKVVNKNVDRYFVSLNKVCKILLEIINMNEVSLFVVDMGKPINIYKMAQQFLIKNKVDSHNIIPIKIRPGDKINELLFYENEKLDTLNKLDLLGGKLFIDKKNIDYINTLITANNSTIEKELKNRIGINYS